MTAFAWIVVWAAWIGPSPAEVPSMTDEVFEAPNYEFCHDDSYPLTRYEARWCDVPTEQTRCPAFARACANQRRAVLFGSSERMSRRVVSEDERDDEVQVRRPAAAASPVLGILFWAAAIGALAVVAFLILRNLAEDTGDEDEEDLGDEDASDADARALEAAKERQREVEKDVQRLLDRAEKAAGRHDYGSAVDWIYAALLRWFEHLELIDMRPSLTNGDYLRALGDRPELQRVAKAVISDVESIQFGGAEPDQAQFRSLADRVLGLVKRGAPLVVFGLLGLLSACPNSGDNRPWNTSPSGTSALRELVTRAGGEIAYQQGPLQQGIDEDVTDIILMSDAKPTPAQMDILTDWVRKEDHTLFLTGQEVSTIWIERGPPSAAPVEFPYAGPLRIGLPPGPTLSLREPNARELAQRGESAYAAELPLSMGYVVVLPDDEIFRNAALARTNVGVFVLDQLGPNVLLVDALSLQKAATPFEAMHESGFAPAVLHLLALTILLIWWRGRPLGVLRDPPLHQRRRTAEHAHALARLYQRSRANRWALSRYADWAIRRLRERVRPREGGLHPLAQAIAAHTGRDESEVMVLLLEAQDHDGESIDAAERRVALSRLRELVRLVHSTQGKR